MLQKGKNGRHTCALVIRRGLARREPTLGTHSPLVTLFDDQAGAQFVDVETIMALSKKVGMIPGTGWY